MADETAETAAGTPPIGTATALVGTATVGVPPGFAASGGSAIEGETYDPERAAQTIRALREREREGEKAARERDALAAKLKDLEDAQKSEAERQAEELERLRAVDTEYKTERKRWAAERAVLIAAPKSGIGDVALAMAVLDVASIEFENEQPTNVDDVLAELVEKHPALAAGESPKPRTPKTDADKGRTRVDAPKLTAEQMAAAEAMKMSPEDFVKFQGIRSADQYAAIAAAGEKE